MPGHRLSARIHHRGTGPFALRRRLRPAAMFLLAAACGGCASFSPDGGMALVNGIVAPELKSDVVKLSSKDLAGEAHPRAARLLGSTLSADAAVRVALLNNKGLQAAYNELGIAEAAMVEASLPPNPTFSLSRISTPVELDIERRIVADILALATLPARAEIAADRFRQAQLRAAEETLRVGAETRRSLLPRRRGAAARWLPGAGECPRPRPPPSSPSELGETGAMNKLDQAREQAFYAELAAQLATARQRAASERERLVRALGLCGRRSRVQAAGGAAAAAQAAASAACGRNRGDPPPRRSADRAHRSRCARQVLRADQRDALHQSPRRCRRFQDTARSRRRGRHRRRRRGRFPGADLRFRRGAPAPGRRDLHGRRSTA